MWRSPKHKIETLFDTEDIITEDIIYGKMWYPLFSLVNKKIQPEINAMLESCTWHLVCDAVITNRKTFELLWMK